MPNGARELVCGTSASPDAVDLATPLRPEDFGFPRKDRYYADEVARRMARQPDDPNDVVAIRRAYKTAMRTIERDVERGRLRATRFGRLIVIPAAELARYFLEASTLVSAN